MRLKIFLAVAIIALFTLSPLFALDTGPGSTYGRGVHAFFAGKHQKAHTELSKEIKAKTIDPRVYFFRGLAAYRMGRADAAKADFQEGGQLEVSKTNYFFDVSKALTRIQGKERLLIEQARSAARLEKKKKDKRQATLRYETTQRQEDRVLRKSILIVGAATFEQTSAVTENQPNTPATPKASPKGPAKKIRLDRIFKALSGSIMMPGGAGGMPPMQVTPMAPPSGWKEMPSSITPMGVPSGGGVMPSEGMESPPTVAPMGTPAPAQEDENPFSGSSTAPAASFSKMRQMLPEGSDLLVVVGPVGKEPAPLVPDPAPAFEKKVLPSAKEELPPIVKNPEPEVVVAVSKVEETSEPVVEPTPELSPIVKTPEPEVVAAVSKVEETSEPVVEPTPELSPIVKTPEPEVVAAAEPVKEKSSEQMAELAPELPLVEETPKPELVAQMTEPPVTPVKEEPAPVVEEEPVIAVAKPVIKEEVIKEEPIELLAKSEPVTEAPGPESLAMEMVVKDNPFASPAPKPKQQTFKEASHVSTNSSKKTSIADSPPSLKTSEIKKPVAVQSSNVKAAPAKPPVDKRPASPKTQRKPSKSGASAIESLDLNNLPPEEDPFA